MIRRYIDGATATRRRARCRSPLLKLGILLLIGLPVAPGVAAANEFVPVPVPITRFDPDVHGFFSTEALADDADAQLRRRNNPGGNLGELRRNSVQAAATYLTEFLEFKEPVVVDASFEDLSALCDESSGIAAQGVANDARVITFDVEPPLKIVYPIALANTLFGTDLAPANADISVVFNNAVGADDCLSVGWDYSIGVEAVAGVSLFDTSLREMFRGLGFQSYVDLTTGARQIVAGEPVSDIFSFQLVDYGVGLNWHDMTDAQRLTSATGGTLAFGGALSRAQARRLADGFSLPIGQDPLPRMYAPGTLNPLYSVSHFDPSVTPGDLMEPTPDFVIDHTMAAKVLYDLQWPGTLCMNLVVPPYTWVKLSADCDLEGVGTAGTLFRDSAVYQYIEWWVYDSALRRYDRVDSGDPIAAGDAAWLIHSAAEPLHLRMPQASLPQALDSNPFEAQADF